MKREHSLVPLFLVLLLITCSVLLVFEYSDEGNDVPNFNTTAEHTHEYIVKVIEPTCKSEGYTLHKCVRCGYEMRDEKTAIIIVFTISF